jgi:hypothetical protein
MAYTVIIHMANEDPVIAEMEALPEPNSTCVICTEVRRRDGKPVHYLTPEATTFIFPWARIGFIEVLSAAVEKGEVLEFFRD